MKPWCTEYVSRAYRLGPKVLYHCCGCVWEALPIFWEAGFDGYEGI